MDRIVVFKNGRNMQSKITHVTSIKILRVVGPVWLVLGKGDFWLEIGGRRLSKVRNNSIQAVISGRCRYKARCAAKKKEMVQ